MQDPQERLLKASHLARLQAIIDLTRGETSSLAEWRPVDRRWFAHLLGPFAIEEGDRRLLAELSAESPAPPPILDLVQELRRSCGNDRDAVLEELEATVSLLRKLLSEDGRLEAADIQRVRKIASILRRRLIRSQSFLLQAANEG